MDYVGIDLHKTSSRVCILTAASNGVSAGGRKLHSYARRMHEMVK